MPLYSTDREVIETAISWLETGHRPALVTVARTWGSSPRPAGSLMLMRNDGVYTGSVSGGCVEEDLVARYRDRQIGDVFPTLIDYGINQADAARLGLPCGGRLELLVERLDSPAQLHMLLERIKTNALMTRRVCLNTGEISLHPASAGDEFCYADGFLSKVFGPRWQLLLIGAGHLSHYVAQIALMLDYRVMVCDPRESYEQHDIDAGVERLNCMPDEAVQACSGNPRCVVLALTHDPRLDDMALLDALQSPAFYVGAIGSRQNSDRRRERLGTLGVSTEQLQRLHAPVGLPIGSRSPPEIAVSIMAEITALRNRARQLARDIVTTA
jgi:xanthine dehydrogenase accessory factor